MKIFKRSLKEYFDLTKIFMLVIFILSIAQIFLILSGYFPKIEIVKVGNAAVFKTDYLNAITLIGVLELVVVFMAGFYLTQKNKFSLRHSFIASIFLFSSSLLAFFFIPSVLPEIPFLFKVISSIMIVIANFILFIIVSLLSNIIAIVYKKFK